MSLSEALGEVNGLNTNTSSASEVFIIRQSAVGNKPKIFRADLFHVGFNLDKNFGFFWCEDTDLSFQSMYLNKINYRINGNNYIDHKWGGGGEKYHDLFIKNWEYLKNKWKSKFLDIR